MITQSELKTLFNYEPETGLFIRLTQRRGSRFPIGSIAGYVNSDGYISIEINKKEYKASRLAWLYVYGYHPPILVDHINMVRSDNRIINLRLATHRQNKLNQNIRPDNKSGYKGVSYRPNSKKFVAYATLPGKKIYLGIFHTAEEAHSKYSEFAIANYGEFHRF